MIKSIHFTNFRALRDATLPLGPFTLIVGPNGSGKSTAMEALKFFREPRKYSFHQIAAAGLSSYDSQSKVRVSIRWMSSQGEVKSVSEIGPQYVTESENVNAGASIEDLQLILSRFQIFSFDAQSIASAVPTTPNPQLESDGSNLPAVLDALRDSHPERFEELNVEFHRWLPEFDRILFETPAVGKKSFLVRTTVGHHRLPAADLSQGVLFALTFLALAYLPEPPSIVCFEEPDRGIHPRLLVDIRDAMYRLAFPEKYGEKRAPVQVIATTHSPYLLDLYKEHPEQIVIAHKDDHGAHFERLSEKPHLKEILEGAPLGEVWFSGILGGVPSIP